MQKRKINTFIILGVASCAITVFLLSNLRENYHCVPPIIKNGEKDFVPNAIRFASNTHTMLHPHIRKSHAVADATSKLMLKKPSENFEDYARRLVALANKNMTQWFLHQHELTSFDDVVHVTTSFRDNYVYWLFTAARYVFGIKRPLEMVEPEDILFRGYGFCSQHALLIAGILERQGIQARIHALNGHVVPEMIAPDGQSYVLDTNANLVLSGTVSALAEKPDLLEKAYFQSWLEFYTAFAGVTEGDANYDAIRQTALEDAKTYAALYTTQEDNKVFDGTDDYVNFWETRFWRYSKIAKYLLPLLLGLALMCCLIKQRKNDK